MYFNVDLGVSYLLGNPYKGFSNGEITILSMNKTQKYLRY